MTGADPLPPTWRTRAGRHMSRWMPLVAVSLLTYVLFPVVQGLEVSVPEVGNVAVTQVVAPFDFEVRKSEAELQREREEFAAGVRPIYRYHEGRADSVAATVDSLFAALARARLGRDRIEAATPFGLRLTGAEADYLDDPARRAAFRRSLRRMASRHLTRGVVAGDTVGDPRFDDVFLRRGDDETRAERDSILTRSQWFALANLEHPDPNSTLADQLYFKVMQAVFRPTVSLNEAETEARREARRAEVDPVKDQVRQNERIIGEHEIVTARVRDRLVALQQELLDRGGLREGRIRSAIGQVLTNSVVLAVFWLLLMLYLKDVYANVRQVTVFAGLFAVVIAGAAVNFRFIHPGPELIPIPFAAIVITVLFNGRISMVGAIVLAVLLGSQVAYGGQDAFYIAMLGGVGAALSVRVIRRRTAIFGAVAGITVAYVLGALTVGLRVGWTISEMGMTVVRGGTNATISAALAFLMLPIFERWSRVTTALTLLELSDPNQPLLRRLATEVPGTYAHSLAMANLCEAACDAIGADGLLARVGCYYHDIGKLIKPLHFVENQGRGGNPHDRLPPDVSAAIIRNHVVEGYALAEAHGLPPSVAAFIPEHHGTMEITYFLDRAKKGGPIPEDMQHVYAYPGPRPQSAETAVCMLADGVEAALRVLDDPSPRKLRDAIDHVVAGRMAAGQLAEAPLTLRQIDTAKDAFVHILSGMYHNRLDYPEEAGGITADWDASAKA